MVPSFQILALSGGGYLGLYTATVLSHLEQACGVPLGRKFDLLAGTSVGGIIALGLAAEVPAKEIKSAFEEFGTTIFSRRSVPKTSVGRGFDLLRSALTPKYDSAGLRETLLSLFPKGLLIGDLLHPVIIPTVNLTKGKPQIFKTPHHPTFVTDLHRSVIDVAIAGAAAPTFFPIAEVANELYADGGLYANAPDILALHEAEHFLGASVDGVRLLSVGTTTAQFSFSHEHGNNIGITGWLSDQRLINVILASQQQSVGYMAAHRLGDRYLRLDALQSKEQERYLALDVATEAAQKTIRGLADSTAQEHASDPILKSILEHTAKVPTFYP